MEGVIMLNDIHYQALSVEYKNLYHEYEREFGLAKAQVSPFASEALPIGEIIQQIRKELSDEYLKNPDKENLRKYLRDKLEGDMAL